jgi:hypothetical protein
MNNQPRLLDQARQSLRTSHYSIRAETAYVDRIRRFIQYRRKRYPAISFFSERIPLAVLRPFLPAAPGCRPYPSHSCPLPPEGRTPIPPSRINPAYSLRLHEKALPIPAPTSKIHPSRAPQLSRNCRVRSLLPPTVERCPRFLYFFIFKTGRIHRRNGSKERIRFDNFPPADHPG